jgi:soluble lytic murein transglycosylase-like protein
MLFAMCRRAGAITLLGMSIVASARAGVACEAQLSAAQRERFAMAVQGCGRAAEAAPAAPERHADALVASDLPVNRPTLEPALQSAHLQLFAKPGVVAAQVPQVEPAPPRVAQRAAPRRPQKAVAKLPMRAVTLAPQIDEVARRHDIDPLLLHAIAWVESRHDAGARSPAGALGVMQVMPATAQRFGVAAPQALHEARTNLEVGAAYLKTLQQRFGLNLPLILAAYNAGEGAVERNGRRIPAFPETQDYVRQVLAQYRTLTTMSRTAAPARAVPAVIDSAF